MTKALPRHVKLAVRTHRCGRGRTDNAAGDGKLDLVRHPGRTLVPRSEANSGHGVVDVSVYEVHTLLAWTVVNRACCKIISVGVHRITICDIRWKKRGLHFKGKMRAKICALPHGDL